jgi:hypothetical protein
VALWREGLLARGVLRDETRGCRHHPQPERFRARRADSLPMSGALLRKLAQRSIGPYSRS